MDTFYFVLIEIISTTVFGFLGSYISWVLGGKKTSYNKILEKYGYSFGVLGAVITILILIFFF